MEILTITNTDAGISGVTGADEITVEFDVNERGAYAIRDVFLHIDCVGMWLSIDYIDNEKACELAYEYADKVVKAYLAINEY